MINWFRVFIQEHKYAFFSGILIGTSYIPFPPWALLFLFVPLWWYWFQNSNQLKKILISGWICQFTLNLIGFYWVAYVSHEHGNIPWPFSIMIMLLFCSLGAYFIPLSGGLWFFLEKKITSLTGKIALLALITALCERFYVTLFPWNLGYPLFWGQFPAYQVADLIGFNGLSALIILLNGALFYCYYQYRNKALVIRPLIVSLSLFAAINVFGFFHVKRLSHKDQKTLKVLTVQANIGNLQKEHAQRGAGFRSEILNKYLQLTNKALAESKDVDFVLWPETAIPFPIANELVPVGVQRPLLEFILNHKTPLISGGYFFNTETKGIANSLMIFNQNAKPLHAPYKKYHLLAFGEYMPGAQYFPALAQRFNIGSFERGAGPKSYGINGVTIGPQICYESLFEDFSIELAQQKTDIFLNITNDSWFGPTSEPFQNLYMTLARGIEHRRPVIRATNTGFTSIMTPEGELLERSLLFKEWTHKFEVPYYATPITTFYQKYPWLITALLSIALLFTVIWDRFKYGSYKKT